MNVEIVQKWNFLKLSDYCQTHIAEVLSKDSSSFNIVLVGEKLFKVLVIALR